MTIAVGGVADSSTSGNYPAELTTNRTNDQAPILPADTGLAGTPAGSSYPIDTGVTGALTLR